MNDTDDGFSLARLKRIGAGYEIAGPGLFQQLLLEDKILKLVERRENIKSKSDVISSWMVAAITEALGSLGVLLRKSYRDLKPNGD